MTERCMLLIHTRLLRQRVGSCYLEVTFGTTGVDTWCYLEFYLVLPGVLPGVTRSVTWCYLGVAWRRWRYLGFLFWSSFFCGPKMSAFLKLELLDKNQFPPRDVAWAHACSRYLFTWLPPSDHNDEDT